MEFSIAFSYIWTKIEFLQIVKLSFDLELFLYRQDMGKSGLRVMIINTNYFHFLMVSQLAR